LRTGPERSPNRVGDERYVAEVDAGEERGFARDPDFVRTLGVAALLGLVVGAAATAFIVGLRHVTDWLWPEESTYGTGFFDGEWWMVAVLAGAGLAVGLSRRLLGSPSTINLFTELEEGRVDPHHVPSVLVTGFLSLLSGASLGPEAPLATLGGGLGTYAADRSGRDARVESFAGISAALGGLLGLPLFGTALALELEHPQRIDYYRVILPGLVASAVGTGVFLTATDVSFFGAFDLGAAEFHWWYLLAAVPLGLLGAGAAVLAAVLFGVARRLTAPLAGHPVLLPVLGGAVMGLVAVAFPLTLFSGEHQLVVAVGEAEALGGWLLVAIAVAKLVALVTAMSTGFLGGPIFPMLFAGGAIGLAVHTAFPDVPIAIALSCVMAATPAAFANLPISMLVIVLVLVGGGPVAAPAAIAVVVAFSATYGLGLFPPRAPADAGTVTA
jgi:H+/Cl- antiporter ClcA